MKTTYINDIDSIGEVVRLEHLAGLIGEHFPCLPSLLEDTDFTSVLDVGSGSGRWAWEMAFQRQDVQVSAVDISQPMIQYAQARARTQRLENVTFHAQDFLANELPFPEHSFDLIHARFAMSWLQGYVPWLLFVTRCFTLLKPGGWVVITEAEGIETTSPTLQRVQELLRAAFFKTGYSLSGSERSFGVVTQLGRLLHEAGFQKVQIEANVLDYSHYHAEANWAWRDQFHTFLNETALFLINAGVTTAEEITQLDQQLLIEMFKPEFCGITPLFTFFAHT